MPDLTPDELLAIERSLGGPELVATSKSETCRMVAELTRRRAEQRAGAEHVRRVVREAVSARPDLPSAWAASMARDIAARVADQLVPVLSGEDGVLLRNLKAEIKEYGIAGTGESGNATPVEQRAYYALLDRLLVLCPSEQRQPRPDCKVTDCADSSGICPVDGRPCDEP